MPYPQLITHLVIILMLATSAVVLGVTGDHTNSQMFTQLLFGYLGARGVDIGFVKVRNGNGNGK